MKKYAKCGKIFLKLYHRYVDILCDTRSITINFQGGMTMTNLFKKSKKLIALALAVVMCAATALTVAKTNITKAGETPTVSVEYDLQTDQLTVKLGEKNYLFYTTDNASKKVPAANKWTRVPSGTINCYDFTKGKTLYFAMTTTPELKDIVAVKVPAQPKITNASYNAVEGKWTVKIGSKDVSNVATTPLSTDIESLQLTGGTVFVYVDAYTTTDKKVTEDTKVIDLKKAEGKTAYEFPEGAARRSNEKYVKIAKRAGGPAVTVDWANHYVKVGKGVEAATADDLINSPDYKKLLTAATIGKSTGYFFDDAATIFNFRTAKTTKKIASLETVLSVPATSSFEAKASIIGGYQQDAQLEVKPVGEQEKGTTISYQYAILDATTKADVIKTKDSSKYFDYKTAIDKKVKWTTIKYSVDKNGKVKTATAKIVNSKTTKTDKTLKEGTVVLVREAAKANKPSSKVIIFEIPNEATPYWKSTKIDSSDVNNEISVSPASVVYDKDTKKSSVKVVVNNGKTAVTDASVKDKFTLNKLAVTPSVKVVGENAEITFEVPDTLVKDSVDLKVAAKAGFIVGSTYTYSSVIKGADLKLPTLVTNTPTSKWTASSDGKQATVTVKVELSENLATYNDSTQKYEDLAAGDVVAKFKTASENYELKKATYAKKTSKKKAYIEFELTYSLNVAAPADGAITYNTSAELFDAAGHKLEITNISVKADSTLKKYEEPTTTTASAS